MSPATDPQICLVDGEITIDAAFLAPKLGLSVEALRSEMRLGRVVSTVEEGRDEDAGSLPGDLPIRGKSLARGGRGGRTAYRGSSGFARQRHSRPS